jgi:hypothetical protein
MAKLFCVALALGLMTPLAQCQDSWLPFVLTHRTEPFSQRPAAPLTLTVPAETEVAVQMLSGIHTQINHVNDPIMARLLQPVYVDGRLALPSGTLLDGRITSIRSARRLHRPAELVLRFESISLPDGQSEPISAVLAGIENSRLLKTRLDFEGHLEGARRSSWKALVAGLVGAGTFATVKAAVASSAALTYLAPASGAALVGYEILWPKGNDVHLPPDTRCRLRLNYPLTVRVPW